jgi:hypothetical protein
MEPNSINNEILNELKQLRMDVNILKQNTLDSDTILTDEEEEILEESYENEKNGELISSEDLKKELEI